MSDEPLLRFSPAARDQIDSAVDSAVGGELPGQFPEQVALLAWMAAEVEHLAWAVGMEFGPYEYRQSRDEVTGNVTYSAIAKLRPRREP